MELIEGTDLAKGPRNPRANTAFEGKWMVIDVVNLQRLEDEPEYTFSDASGIDGWCLVGNDMNRLIATSMSMFD